MHNHSLSFVPYVSPQQYAPFMHLQYSSMTFLLFGDLTCQIQMMYGGKEQKRAHYAICQSIRLHKRLYRKEPINKTFSSCSLQQNVGASWAWHNTGAGMSEMEISRKGGKSEKWHCFSPVQKLLICSNCMSWLKHSGILSFKSYFHCSFIPAEILTTKSALSPLF